MNIKPLLVAATILTSTPVYAFNGWMNIHIGSLHSESEYEQDGEFRSYNNNNYGIGVALPLSEDIEFVTGFFDNSYNKTSVYLGNNLHTSNQYGFSAGIITALVTGYDETPNTRQKIILTLVPHVTYSLKNVRAELGIMPSLGSDNRAPALTLTIGTRF